MNGIFNGPDRDGKPYWLALQLNAIRNMIFKCVENGIKHMVFLGDITESKDRIPGLIVNSFVDIVRDMSNNGITSYWLEGNHKPKWKGAGMLELVEDVNVHVFRNPCECKICDKNFLFVPYHPESDGFSKAVNSFDLENIDSIFCHQEIKGSFFNNQRQSYDGYDPSNIDTKIFAGHIHKPQDIGNVYIPGSISPVDEGEAGHKKRFLIYDLLHDTVQSCPIDFPGFDKYVVDVSAGDSVEELLESYDMMGRFVKMIVEVPKPMISDYDASAIKKYIIKEKMALNAAVVICIRSKDEHENISTDIEVFSDEKIYNEFSKKLCPKNLSSDMLFEYLTTFSDACDGVIDD